MGTVKRVSERRSLKKKTQYKAKATPYKKRTVSARPGRVVGLTKNDFGFPDRLSTKLVYCDAFNIAASGGAVASNTFRLNSLYDPDLTNVGHQPQWFDQLATVYQKYRVKGAKITVTFSPFLSNVSGNEIGPFIVGITTSTSPLLNASSNITLLEDANGVNATVGNKAGGNNVKTLSNTFTPMRDLGIDSYDDTLAASTGTNPVTMFYGHTWFKDIGQATYTTTMSIQVKIEFTCEFFSRIEGVPS